MSKDKKQKKGKKEKKPAYIGIDIGGTKTLYALFDEAFEVVAEEKLPTTPKKPSASGFTRAFTREVKSLIGKARRHGMSVRAIGIGCAGDIDMRNGVVRSSPNLPFLDGYQMCRALRKLSDAPAYVANDVVAGLYGEFRRGAAKGARHVMGIWIGTGVGGAVIIGGRLHLGVKGRAGDIGNYVLHAGDTGLEAPRKERIDHVASRYAIAGVAASMAAKHHAPQLRAGAGTDVSDIKAGDLAEAIKKGDKAVEKLVRHRTRVLGLALGNLVDFLNPDLIVLGGGLVEAMPRLIKREIRKSIDAHATPKAARAVKVAVAKLERHAINVGAACLALDMQSRHPPIDLAEL